MGRGLTEAQWLAARELSEGQPPTRVRVAAVLGVDNSHVYSRSSAEGWKTIDHRKAAIAKRCDGSLSRIPVMIPPDNGLGVIRALSPSGYIRR